MPGEEEVLPASVGLMFGREVFGVAGITGLGVNGPDSFWVCVGKASGVSDLGRRGAGVVLLEAGLGFGLGSATRRVFENAERFNFGSSSFGNSSFGNFHCFFKEAPGFASGFAL